MSRQTTLSLGVVAAALAVYILAFERHSLTSEDLSGRSGRLLPRFVSERVTSLVMDGPAGRIELVREREEEEELGVWTLAVPSRAPADSDAVGSLLSTLEWAEPDRVLEGVSDAERRDFGLDEPAVSFGYTVAGEQRRLALGQETPTGGHYAVVDEGGPVYVVGQDVWDVLARDAWHFRDKRLFAGHDPSTADAVSVRSAEGQLRLARVEGRWWLRAPSEAYARDATVAEALSALSRAKATRLVVESPPSAEQYGLGPDARALVLSRRGDDAFESTLRLGAPCEGHEGELFARVEEGPVLCVPEGEVLALFAPAAELRLMRLLTVDPSDVVRVTIRRPGHAGLELRQEEEGWVHQTGDDAPITADGSAVEEWLEALEGVTATGVGPVGSGSTMELGFFGDGPAAVESQLEVGLGSGAPWALRAGEGQALLLPEASRSLFEVEPLHFRPRQLIEELDTAVQRIVVKGRGREVALERSDGGWVTSAGETADPVLARDLVRRLGSLAVQRYVAPRPVAAHGLAAPRWSVELMCEGAAAGEPEPPQGSGETGSRRTYRLRVGVDADGGGAFAQLGDDATVFVVSARLRDDLNTLLGD